MVVNYYAAVPLAISVGALFYMLCRPAAGAVSPDLEPGDETGVHVGAKSTPFLADNTIGTMGLEGAEMTDWPSDW